MRTVASLLGLIEQKKDNGNQEEKVKIYIYCKSKNICRIFLQNAEKEGFTFGDGAGPASRETDDLYCLQEDWTISYVGWAGHLFFRNPEAGYHTRLVRVDYGKYLAGSEDYIM